MDSDVLSNPLLTRPPRPAPDAAITELEVSTLIELAAARGAAGIAIGRGRTPAALAAADAITGAHLTLSPRQPSTRQHLMRKPTATAHYRTGHRHVSRGEQGSRRALVH